MSMSNGRTIIIVPVAETVMGTLDALLAWVVKRPMTIYRVSCLVTTALGNYTTQAVMTLSKTQASPAVAIDAKANITMVKNSAVGTELEGVVNEAGDIPLDVEEGDTLTFGVSTAAVDNTTGAAYWMLEAEVRGEKAA